MDNREDESLDAKDLALLGLFSESQRNATPGPDLDLVRAVMSALPEEPASVASESDPRLVAALQRSLNQADSRPSQRRRVHSSRTVSFGSLFVTLGGLSTIILLRQSLFSPDGIPLNDAILVLANLFLFVVVFLMGLVVYGRRLMQQDITTRMGLLQRSIAGLWLARVRPQMAVVLFCICMCWSIMASLLTKG